MYNRVNAGEKELRRMVVQTHYNNFYDDTNREIIRLEKEKMSHFECSKGENQFRKQ